MSRTMVLAGLVAAVACGIGVANGARSADDEPQAFDRPARPSDRLPAFLRLFPDDHAGRVVTSRLVATYNGGPKRSGRLYLFKTSRGMTCNFFVWRGAGGGCSPSPLFAERKVAAGAGQFLSGVAANEVTRVVVIGSRGVRHHVPLSSDKGFIYDCRTYNGCVCAVAWLDAYVGDRRVEHQDWLGSGCARTRR